MPNFIFHTYFCDIQEKAIKDAIEAKKNKGKKNKNGSNGAPQNRVAMENMANMMEQEIRNGYYR